jgi:hypothetical protein
MRARSHPRLTPAAASLPLPSQAFFGAASLLLAGAMSLLHAWSPRLRDDHHATLLQYIIFSEALYSLKYFVSALFWAAGFLDDRASFHVIPDDCFTSVAYGQFFGMAAISWNACWMVDILFTLFQPLRNTATHLRWYHAFVWSMAAGTTLIVAATSGHSASDAHTCWLRGDAVGGSSWSFEAPLFAYLLLALASLAAAVCRLRSPAAAAARLRSSVLARHLLYVAAFVVVWIFPVVHAFLDPLRQGTALTVSDAVAVGGQAALSVAIRLTEPSTRLLLGAVLRKAGNSLGAAVGLKGACCARRRGRGGGGGGDDGAGVALLGGGPRGGGEAPAGGDGELDESPVPLLLLCACLNPFRCCFGGGGGGGGSGSSSSSGSSSGGGGGGGGAQMGTTRAQQVGRVGEAASPPAGGGEAGGDLTASLEAARAGSHWRSDGGARAAAAAAAALPPPLPPLPPAAAAESPPPSAATPREVASATSWGDMSSELRAEMGAALLSALVHCVRAAAAAAAAAAAGGPRRPPRRPRRGAASPPTLRQTSRVRRRWRRPARAPHPRRRCSAKSPPTWCRAPPRPRSGAPWPRC